MTRFSRFTHYALILFLAGCSSLAPLLPTVTPVPVSDATATPQLTPTSTPVVQTTTPILRVWLPPQFDPEAGTQSADLLKSRLAEFENDHPGLKIEVRIKGGDNTDIVDYLSATGNAAHTIIPDLIALSYDQMQTAASIGLLHPLDGITDILQDPDWYVFSRELSSVQNIDYGIPFAADAMVMVYRPAIFETPPSDWDTVIGSGTQITFAFDAQSYFPLSLYDSARGQPADEQGAFTLDESILVRVLSLYQRAYEANALLPSIKNVQSDADALNHYRNGEASLAVVWASSDIGAHSGSYTALLGLDDAPYSIGNGWVWALAGTNTENQTLAAELASYLAESAYLSEWTYASGYLPTRPLALDGWGDNTAVNSEIDSVLLSAHPGPLPEVVSMFGPIMQGALTRIFNGEQAEVVARSVIEELK